MKITKHTKLKRKEYLKAVAIFCAIQIGLACFLVNIVERTKVATDSNIIQKKIIIDNIYKEKYYKRGVGWFIVSNSREYTFIIINNKSDDLNISSIKTLKTGDELNISYINVGKLKKYSWIVEASNENGIYSTIDNYNREMILCRRFLLVFLLVLEVFAVLLFVLFSWASWPDLKFFQKNKKKREKARADRRKRKRQRKKSKIRKQM